jgi:hypothetical protein
LEISRASSQHLKEDLLDLSSLKDEEIDTRIQNEIQQMGFLDSQKIIRKNNQEWTQMTSNTIETDQFKNSTAQSGIREMIQQMEK